MNIAGAEALLSLIFSFLLLTPVLRLLENMGAVGKNFMEEITLHGGGIFFLAVLTPVLLIMRPAGWGTVMLLLFSLGIAGLWDDFRGEKMIKGFSGHLQQFFRGRLTSGMLKLIAGGCAALAAAFLSGRGLMTALVTALSANLFNLLDLRPGRALKVFIFFGYISLPLGGWQALPFLLPLLAAAFAFLPLDLDRKVMLGDSGANILGAALGFQWGMYFNRVSLFVILLFLLLLQIANERISFSAVIARSRVMRAVDMLGRSSEIDYRRKPAEFGEVKKGEGYDQDPHRQS